MDNDIWKCNDCDTVYTSIKLKDIPEEKMLAQRKQYTQAKQAKYSELMNQFSTGMYGGFNTNPLADLFSEKFNEPEIIESDAGQKIIDEREYELQRIKREKLLIKRQEDKELAKQYSKLSRNEICLCGSIDSNGKPKKYKKCCWSKINNIR